MSWAKEVEQKEVDGDIVLTGYRQLTKGNQPTCIPGAGTLSLSVYVKASANGDKYQPEFNVWLEGAKDDSVSAKAKEFTVSAKQSMNVNVDEGVGGEGNGSKTSDNGVTLGVGVIKNFDVTIQLGDETTSKGSEGPKGKITFDLVCKGTKTLNPNTVQGNPKTAVAYVKSDNGDVSYVENDDGTFTVTLENYTVPDLSAANATSPLDLFKITVGVFQEQPGKLENNTRYDIELKDKNLKATSISGAELPAPTDTDGLNNQTVTNDDQGLLSLQYVVGQVDAITRFMNSTTFDYINTGTQGQLGIVDNKDIYSSVYESTPGQTVQLGASIGNPRMGNLNNCVQAGDVLIKFDDKTLEIDDDVKWSINIYADSEDMIKDGKATLRFAAKSDGSGWTSSTECAQATMRDLVYYDSLAELKADNKTCVGVVCEIRDINAYRSKTAANFSNNKAVGGSFFVVDMKVKEDMTLVDKKAVPYFTVSHRYYTSAGDIPTANQHAETSSLMQAEWEGGVTPTNGTSGWHANNTLTNKWTPNYWDGNDRVPGANNWCLGFSMYLIKSVVKMNYAIESQDINGDPKTVYNLADDNKVDLVITPEVISTIDDKHSIAYTFQEPIGTHLDLDSVVIGGTYDPATGKVTGGEKVAITSTTTSGGINTYRFEVQSVSNSEIKPMHFSLTFDDTITNGQTFNSRGQMFYGFDGNASTSSPVGMNGVSFTAIKVGDIKFSKVVETTDKTDATGTEAGSKQGLTYKVGMQNNSSIDITDMKVVDVLPYNGDSQGTKYEGSYTVDPITLDLKGSKVSEKNIKLYYTTDKSVQKEGYNAGEVDLTDAMWKEAKNTGSDEVPVYTVDKNATAVVLIGNLPVDTEYVLDIPFDTTKMSGVMGNQVTISSPDIASSTPGEDGVVTTNGTSTEVVSKVNVTNTLTNIVTNNINKTTDSNKDYEETLTAVDGYHLPPEIDVTVGGNKLTPAADLNNPQPGEYVYDQTTGKVKVPGVEVTDDIVVTATAIKDITITNKLTNIYTDQKVTEIVDEKTPYEETLSTPDGYELPNTIDVTIGGNKVTVTSGTPTGGIAYDKDTGKVTIDGASVTDDVLIEAIATPKKYQVTFTSDPGGTVNNGTAQSVDYKSNPTAGTTATPDGNHVFIGWEYNYTGIDGKTYKGTTKDYTSVVVNGDIEFTAKYASDNSVSASANHGYVNTSASTTPGEATTDTNSTTDLVTADGKNPSGVSFNSQDNYKPSKVTIKDKDGNVIETIDLSDPNTVGTKVLNDGTEIVITNDGKKGTITSVDAKSTLQYEFDFTPETYNLTNTLTGLTTDKTSVSTVTYGEDYKETLYPGFKGGDKLELPKTITVKVGGNELTPANDPSNPKEGEYGYNPDTGEVLIPGTSVTGDVEIIGKADLKVTNNLTNIITNNKQTSITIGSDYKETLSPKPGYRLPETITVTVSGTELTPAADPTNPGEGEYGYDPDTGEVFIPGGNVDGSIVVTAITDTRIGTVTSNITNGFNVDGDSVVIEFGKDYTTTIKPNNGYELPKEITIVIGGKTYTITNGTSTDGIRYNSKTGELFIPGNLIDGDVIINGKCVKKSVVVVNPDNQNNNKDSNTKVTTTSTKTGDEVNINNYIFMILISGFVYFVAKVSKKEKEC